MTKPRHIVIEGAGGIIGGRLAVRLVSDSDVLKDRFTSWINFMRARSSPRLRAQQDQQGQVAHRILVVGGRTS